MAVQSNLQNSPNAQARSPNKSAMTELKYRRIADMNQKLRDDYDRPRCKTSDACNKYQSPMFERVLTVCVFSLIQYTKATKDYMVPSVWGPVDKKDDPYAPAASNGCCIIL
jgi:guanine nucleotide-binding protein subunit gamma, fungi